MVPQARVVKGRSKIIYAIENNNRINQHTFYFYNKILYNFIKFTYNFPCVTLHFVRGGFGSDAGSSAGDSSILGHRPDSLGPVDDDEDRIPEELLLKYVVCINVNKYFKRVKGKNLIRFY